MAKDKKTSKDKKPSKRQNPGKGSRKPSKKNKNLEWSRKASKVKSQPTDRNISFNYETIDKSGPYGFKDAKSQGLWGEKQEQQMNDFETTTFEKLGKKHAHSVLCTDLIKKARDRLDELELGYCEDLFSLRLAGRERIWGIRERNVLHILWCDPKHEICPSLK